MPAKKKKSLRLPRWKASLGMYKHLSSIAFATRKEMDRAIDVLWTDDFYNLPHDIASGDTLIVPTEAVPYLEQAGLKFEASEVLSAGDLPPEEIRELRRENGYY